MAVALLPKVFETAAHVIEVNVASRDRRHEREIALTAAREQARHWDAEATRRHQAFREALQLAQQLAREGYVAEAVQIMVQASALLPGGLQAASALVSQPLLPPGGAS